MKKDDASLASLVEGAAKKSAGGWDTQLSAEREIVIKYNDGILPVPMHRGDSKYVSTDVYDGCESLKAQLLETFSGSAQPVQFAPQGADDVDMARDATEYVNYVIMRQNPGFTVFRDTIDTALKARVSVAKVWWDKDSREEEEIVENLPFDAFYAMMADRPDDEIRNTKIDETTREVVTATVVRVIDTSQVRVELVPPEEFGISRNAKSPTDAEIVFHRTLMTADAIRRLGVKASKVKELTEDEGSGWELRTSDVLARNAETDDGIGESYDRDDQSTNRRIEVIEAYMTLDLDGSPKLWRLLVARGKLLIKDAVKRLPFVFFTPLPRAHTFWGSNYAKKLIPIQNARTMLSRSVINHALITNNPRTGVVKGGLINPKELTENRLGGIVNLTRPDALVPIQQTGLNPFVFQMIGQLDGDKEQVTGVSRLSQGLNKDAISKQNSADMVQGLIGVSQTRQKVVARNFVEDFLKNLYLEVYRLVIENEDAERIIEVAGSWKPVDPTKWPDRKDLIAEVHVGFGEQDVEAKKWTGIDTYLRQDPQLAPVYTSDRRYHVLSMILKAMGVRNIDSIIADPATIEPPKPSPEEEAEAKLKEAEAQVKLAQAESAKAQAQSQMQKLQLEGQRDQMKLQLELAKLAEDRRQFDEKIALDRQKATFRRREF